jgi:hypothetical protein
LTKPVGYRVLAVSQNGKQQMSWLYNLGVLIVVSLADRVSDDTVCYRVEWDMVVFLHVIGRSFFHTPF